MTPEERATIAAKLIDDGRKDGWGKERVPRVIAAAIRAAVEEEREVIATELEHRTVMTVSRDGYESLKHAAAYVRARGAR